MVRNTDQSETQLLLHVITGAEPLGLTRADIDFTCLGAATTSPARRSRSCRTSTPSNLAAQAGLARRDGRGVGALRGVAAPPEGDIEIAVVTGSGRSSTGDPALIYPMEMDPYASPIGADPLTFAALQLAP